MNLWTQSEAIALAVMIEAIAPKFGCHVALTGGCLYGGSMKDCDFVLYRIRQVPKIDIEGLFGALAGIGVVKLKGFGFCYKATFGGKKIDFLCPEESKQGSKEDSCYMTDEDILDEDLGPTFR